MPKNMFNDLAAASSNRERFMKKIDTASAMMGGGGSPAGKSEPITETDILNFALNLEYLEAEFYTYAVTGKSISSFGVGTKGGANGTNPTTGGTTIGGKKVTFSDELTQNMVAQISADERAHVVLLRGALGSSAV